MRQYNFSSNLKEQRKGKKLSQAELAKGVGVTQRTVCAWELNERYPTIDKVYDIANFLEIPINTLIC